MDPTEGERYCTIKVQYGGWASLKPRYYEHFVYCEKCGRLWETRQSEEFTDELFAGLSIEHAVKQHGRQIQDLRVVEPVEQVDLASIQEWRVRPYVQRYRELIEEESN